MDDNAVVTPPHVARPLRLHPFHALSIAGSRLGEPATARAFARPYRTVPERLLRWQQEGHLWRDSEPALYLHEYTSGGYTVRGLVGALDLTRRADDVASAGVLPHEGIHPAQADDLAHRMEQMQLHPAPLLLVHRARPALREILAALREGEPLLHLTDRAGQTHRLWPLRGPDLLAAVNEHLGDTRALIADGHHRYAAYLRAQARPGDPAAGRGLVMFVDHDDTPLFLGAIHRSFAGVAWTAFTAAAAATGARVDGRPAEAALAALAPGTLVATDGQAWAAITLPQVPGSAAVEVLHDDLLGHLGRPPERVQHHHSAEEALRALEGRPGVAVLLPAPELGEVMEIVGSGRLLPEKATSFQPKPSVGVVMRSLRDG